MGKLPESATEEKLQTLFSGFGEIEKVLITSLTDVLGLSSSRCQVCSVERLHSHVVKPLLVPIGYAAGGV